MKGFMKSALAAACAAGWLSAVGCHGGGDKTFSCIDHCQHERYTAAARQEVITAFTPQVQNGRILDQTIWNEAFEPGTDKLTPLGWDKLDQLVRRRPQPDPRIFLATARDLSYNPAKSDDFADSRRDLDAKRSATIQKYLAAQTAGRPVPFEVLVHDPSPNGLGGNAARGESLSLQSAYTGRLGSGGGGTSTGGGFNQGGGGTGAVAVQTNQVGGGQGTGGGNGAPPPPPR
jgi:hypothetical protein